MRLQQWVGILLYVFFQASMFKTWSIFENHWLLFYHKWSSCSGGSPYVGKDEQWLLDMLKEDYRMPCPDHVSEAL